MHQFSLESEAHFSPLRMETLAMTGGLVLPPWKLQLFRGILEEPMMASPGWGVLKV